MRMEDTSKQRLLGLIGKGKLEMAIAELLQMDLGSRRNHLVIAISSRFEGHRTKKIQGMTNAEEDRLVESQITNALLEFLSDTPHPRKGLGPWSKRWRLLGLVIGGKDADTATVLHPATKSRRFWIMAASMVLFLSGIIVLLPAALTWKAQLPPVLPPQDTSSSAPLDPPLPDTSKKAIIPKVRIEILSGEIYDDHSNALLEGVKVCAFAIDKQGRSISSPACKTTNAFGQYEIEFNVSDATTMELKVDGTAIGYATRSISMNPKRETSGRKLSLKKI